MVVDDVVIVLVQELADLGSLQERMAGLLREQRRERAEAAAQRGCR